MPTFIGKMLASLRGGPIEQYNVTSFQMDTKVLSVTHDVSATGTQAITGAGFQPSGGVIFMTIDNTEGASWGIFDSSKTLGTLLVNRAGSAGVYEPYDQMYLYNADGTATAAFTITSLDTDGLTITWTKGGTPTGTATIKLLLFR